MGTQRDLRRANHKVQALHKMNDSKTELETKKLFTFKSGSQYQVLETGQIIKK